METRRSQQSVFAPSPLREDDPAGATLARISEALHAPQDPACNLQRPAPSIYLIVFLWVEVFIKFLTEEQFEVWSLTSTSTAVELTLRPTDVFNKIREE